MTNRRIWFGLGLAVASVLGHLSTGCADIVPDGDVQISCEGPSAVELCVHAANAAVELGPHLRTYDLDVRDPEVTGVTWRDAEQWRIRQVPNGTIVCAGPDDCSTVCDTVDIRRGSLATTNTADKSISVGTCAIDGDWDLSAIVHHELGHALGYHGHLPGVATDVMVVKSYRPGVGPSVYTARDIDAITSVRRHEHNTAWDALWAD